MPFPLLPALLGAGVLGGALVLRKKGVFQPKGQPTGTALQDVHPGLISVGDRIMVNTVQPNGSQAHLIVVARGISGSTITVTPADDPPLPKEWGIVYPPTVQVADVIQQMPKLPQFAGTYASSVQDLVRDRVFAKHMSQGRTSQGKGWSSSGKGTPFPPGFNAPQGWGQHQFGAHGAGARFDSHGYTLGGHGYGRAGALAPFGYGRGGGQHRPGGGYAESMSWHSGASSERWPYAGGPQPGRMGCAPRMGASSERWPYGARQWRTNADRPGWPFGPRQAQMGAIDLVGAAYAPPHTHHVFQGTAMGPEAQPDKLVVGRNPWHNVYDKFAGGYNRPYGPEDEKLIVGSSDPIMNKHIMRGKTQGRGW